MADESSKKGSLTKMHFEAFTDATFMHRISEKPTELLVDVNPDSFTRNIALKEMKTKERGQTNSNGLDAGMEAETYTFKLIFDGTGVIDGVKRDLNKELNDFLHVVYCYSNKEKKTNCVIMTYCGEQFLCKIRSLNIQYTLFNRDSSPLRMIVDCSFFSVEKEKERKPKPKIKPKKPDVTIDIPVDSCVCPPPGYELVMKNDQDAFSEYPGSSLSSNM